jgi:hypothetical protein
MTVDLSLQEMDALLLAVERPNFPEDQKVLFESAMEKINQAWIDGIKSQKGSDDDVMVKLMNRDPRSPFRGMVDMTGSP